MATKTTTKSTQKPVVETVTPPKPKTTTPAKAPLSVTSGHMSPQEYMHAVQEYAKYYQIPVQEAQKLFQPYNQAPRDQNMANRRTMVQVPGAPPDYILKAFGPQQPGTTPGTTPTTSTTGTTGTTTPTETPHQRAVRLANEAANTQFKKLYADTHLDASDPYGIHARYMDAVKAAIGKIPATETKYDLNYGDLFSGAMSAATKGQQNLFTQEYNKATPAGWEEKYFANTADDAILNEILKQQYGDVKSTLDRKLGAGQISQGAYDYGMGQIGTLDAPGTLTSSAMGTLQDIGGGVLSTYKTGLDKIAEEFSKNIGNYTLGSTAVGTPGYLSTTLGNKAAEYTGQMKGDITKALGNTQLYDPNALISKAGSVAGPSNQPLGRSTPQGTGVAVNEEDKRTIGTSGVF